MRALSLTFDGEVDHLVQVLSYPVAHRAQVPADLGKEIKKNSTQIFFAKIVKSGNYVICKR